MMRSTDRTDLVTGHQGEADLVSCNNKGHQKKTWRFSDCNISVQSASTGCRGSDARSHLLEAYRWLHFCWFPNYNVVALQRKIDRRSWNTHHTEADHWGKHNIKQLRTLINSQPVCTSASARCGSLGTMSGFFRLRSGELFTLKRGVWHPASCVGFELRELMDDSSSVSSPLSLWSVLPKWSMRSEDGSVLLAILEPENVTFFNSFHLISV